jgi:hypothetical protein
MNFSRQVRSLKQSRDLMMPRIRAQRCPSLNSKGRQLRASYERCQSLCFASEVPHESLLRQSTSI